MPTQDVFVLMRTPRHERVRYEDHATAVDVALDTSAARTFFQSAPFPEHAGASCVDGGVWANRPALDGLVEAVSILSVPLTGSRP